MVPSERMSFVNERIAKTLELISSLLTIVYLLDERGMDTAGAKKTLSELDDELASWKRMKALLLERKAAS